MDPLEKVRREFTRQAAPMAAAPAFTACASVERFRRALRERRAADVLELGCGPGLLAGELAGLARSYTGLDTTPAMIELAVKRLNGWGPAQQRDFMWGGRNLYLIIRHPLMR
jgi:SAM-dependent methyltransferase